MKILVILALLLIPSLATSQQILNIATARLTWTWAPLVAGVNVASEFRMKCATSALGTPVKTTVIAGTLRSIGIKAVVPGPGLWFCHVTAANSAGESGKSNEVAFTAAILEAPSGKLNLIAQP